jgi:ketosteroid isomerase-like protein
MSGEDEVRAAEQALYRAMIAQDFAALRGLLADDLVYVHSTAVAETKDGYLAGVANGLYDYATIASREVTTRVDGNTAVQTGTVAMLVGARGQPKELTQLLFTLVWRREAEGWRLTVRQATRIPAA